MSDDKTDAAMKECADDTKDNREAIREVDRTRREARENVHSEADDDAPNIDAPPPLPS